MNLLMSQDRSATCSAMTVPWKSMKILALAQTIQDFCDRVKSLLQYTQRKSVWFSSSKSSSSFFIYSFDNNLSFLSFSSSSSSIWVILANFFRIGDVMQLV